MTHRLNRLERSLVVAVVLCLAVVGAVVAATGAPVAWFVLGINGALSLAVLVRAVTQRRFFEPLTIVAGVAFVSFFVRPLQLFVDATDLQSWYPPANVDDAVLTLDHSETALFVTRKLRMGLEPALTRTTVAVTLFFVMFLVGYFLPLGRRLAARVSRVGRGVTTPNVRVIVVACLAIGFAGQMAALALAGGPAQAFRGQLDQKVLYAGSPLIMHFLSGFSTVGLICWAAWRRPASRREWVAFSLAAGEVVVYWALAGTRTRVLLLLFMLAIVTHYTWRAWSRRALLGAVLACVVLGASLLSIRQATFDKSIGESLLSAPNYVVNPNGIINDFTEFDILFTATSTIPKSRDYGYGQGIVDALASYVPGPLYRGKPESTDQEFRRFVWRNEVKGGRPYTIVGDFYNDFGFPGIAVGAVLFGLFGRLLLGLVRGPVDGPGRPYRVALYAISAAILYMALATAYTIPIGFFVEFALPFFIAVHVIGPLADRRSGGHLPRLRRRVRQPA